MMPNMDGYELTRQLRKADFNLPILMVTAKETFEDKQEGFSAGTDDYMVKPIDINEMILRVGALLRRSKMASEHSLTVGNCVLDYDAMSVAVDGGAAETIPQWSSSCFLNCSATLTRYSHAASSLTSCGAWIRTLTSVLLTFTLKG